MPESRKAERAKMIFVVGSSRSGTTMLGRILGKNNVVFMLHELHFFEELYDPRSGNAPLAAEKAQNLAATLFARQRNGYFHPGDVKSFSGEARELIEQLPQPVTAPLIFAAVMQYEAVRNGKTIPVEQTPRNVFYLKEILDLYPQAYVLNIIRDSRDVLLSQKLKPRRFWNDPGVPHSQCVRFWANYHPTTISMLWNSSINSADQFKDHPRTFHVRYEDILDDPQEHIGRICSFLDILFDPEMLQVSLMGSSHDLDNEVQLGVNKTAGQRWQHDSHSRFDLAVCQYLTRENLVRYGYEISAQLRLRPVDITRAALTWPVKTGLALLLNVARTRNIFQTIKRRLSTTR
jgi:hypothetical protein